MTYLDIYLYVNTCKMQTALGVLLCKLEQHITLLAHYLISWRSSQHHFKHGLPRDHLFKETEGCWGFLGCGLFLVKHQDTQVLSAVFVLWAFGFGYGSVWQATSRRCQISRSRFKCQAKQKSSFFLKKRYAVPSWLLFSYN